MGSSFEMAKSSTAEVMPDIMSNSSLLKLVAAIVGFYLALLVVIHCAYVWMMGGESREHFDFMTSGMVWDHPEPNFTVSAAITEFWSVLTTIPLAGGLLCSIGFQYRLDWPVMAVFVGTLLMYNFAFFSHMTLWKPIFQLTLTSVMTNCLSAFLLYGALACDLSRFVPLLEQLDCEKCRAKVAGVGVAAVAAAAVRLPDAIGPGGGVWTLFYVQAPPVWIASLAALALKFGSHRDNLRPAYNMVSWAGFFLSSAMFLSYIECTIGTEAVLFGTLRGFPVIHVAIHLSEQVGIYLYGLSLAFLHHANTSPRQGASFRWLLHGTFPIFCCEQGSWWESAGVTQTKVEVPLVAGAAPASK